MFKKNKKIIKIEGMHCNHCAKCVTDALLKIENVSNVHINLNKKEATVTLKKEVDNDTLKKAIEELDYKVIEIGA
jgi:Cu2+-exporting ATPase